MAMAPPPSVVLGELSIFPDAEQARLRAAAHDLASHTATPVCLGVFQTPAQTPQPKAVCPKGALRLWLVRTPQTLTLTLPRGGGWKRVTPEHWRQIKQREMIPLLRKGHGADGLMAGLDALEAAQRGDYPLTPNSFARTLWPLILVATVLLLWAIAEHSHKRGQRRQEKQQV